MAALLRAPIFLCLALTLPASAAAQELRAALSPDTVTVGDVARLGVRALLPPGSRILLPDTLDISGDLENAGRRELVAVENRDGSRTVTAVYPLTAWRPGVDTLPPLEIVLEVDDRRITETLALPVLTVASVLPADTAGIEARPPRDVIGPARVWWIWVLIALAILIAIALLVWWLIRRRRARPVVLEPALSPRERALDELAAIRAERLFDRPSIDPFYERVSAVLRGYLSEVDPRWGRYRTTSELAAAILPATSPEEAAALRSLLREADAVKFAAALPDAQAAQRHLDQVQAWIEAFPPAPTSSAEAEPERAA
ncbi:MAG TPA: DUF4381 family protein [Longimicrobiales bacterium]|nr:DUF4381 family protein [Longimicrobiales bacterium]